MEGKKLWRIHDKDYDLSSFQHPGGQEWIELTRGSDITELVESSHPDYDKIKKLLPKYEVGINKSPRNSGAFTFDENGFYSVFRKRAHEALKACGGSGPTQQMLQIHDLMLCLFLALFVSLANPAFEMFTSSWLLLAIVCAFALQSLATISHNFWHQKRNWRMYTWDFTFYSSHHWRITHAISHHSFPNTAYDYELMAFEPFIEYLPVEKGFLRNLLTFPGFFLLTTSGFHFQVGLHVFMSVCSDFSCLFLCRDV